MKSMAYIVLQSNLYKTTIFGTTQKWSSWTGGRLINNFIKRPQTKFGCSWQVASFYSHYEFF